MIQNRKWLLFLLLAGSVDPTVGQFTCTLNGGQEEDSCINSLDDDGSHCVWCSLSGFGFCVNEQAAEAAEQTLPSVSCDRYSSDDDATPKADDDAVTPTDDTIKPSDDSLPDNYWECLKDKDSKSCSSDGCTWCKSKKYGWGICMTGPTAESAKKSDFFSCGSHEEEHGLANARDPYDTSCVMTYLQDPTEQGCTSTTDAEGNSCKWCNLAGMTNLCLTEEQADEGQALGITCEESSADESTKVKEDVKDVLDPMDPSCIMTFMQDQSKSACVATSDQDGNQCQWCTMQGDLAFCLSLEQAQIAEQTGVGITCDALNPDEEETRDVNPYDTSCVMSSLQGDKESCLAMVDEDGSACQWCSIQGMMNLCLTDTQAEMASGYGIACDASNEYDVDETSAQPTLPDDFWSCLENYEEGDCQQSSCTFCQSNVGVSFCLSTPAAEALKECNFFDCNFKTQKVTETAVTPYDPVCLQAGMQGGDDAKESCGSTVDSDGNSCVWCDAAGVFGLCLSSDQANMAGSWLDCNAVAVQ